MSLISLSQHLTSITTTSASANRLNQDHATHSEVDYSQQLAREMVRSMNKSAEVFKDRQSGHNLSSHFDELSSELLADLIASRLAGNLFALSDSKNIPPTQR